MRISIFMTMVVMSIMSFILVLVAANNADMLLIHRLSALLFVSFIAILIITSKKAIKDYGLLNDFTFNMTIVDFFKKLI